MNDKAQELAIASLIGPVGVNSLRVNADALTLIKVNLLTVNHELNASVQHIEILYVLMPVLRNISGDTRSYKVTVSEAVKQRIVVIKDLRLV